MTTAQKDLLTLLTQECELYSAIPVEEHQRKRDKKHFINGLMTACRVVGVSYGELNLIVEQTIKPIPVEDSEEQLSIPAYIRQQVKLAL